MRYLSILSFVLFFCNCAYTQRPLDTPSFKWTAQQDTSFLYIETVDSLIKSIRSNPRRLLKMANEGLGSNNRIESSGYRALDGTLYTMRIKIPGDNHAALRAFPWTTRLDSIDPKIISPPVINE